MQITIRRAEPADAEGVWHTFRDESAYAGTLQLPHPSLETWRRRLAEPSEGHYVFVACAGEEIVGHAGLHPAAQSPRRAHAMTIGLVVGAQWQGKGVGRALLGTLTDFADGWLNVWRLELTVFADNERAIALYRSFGFEVEGTHRAYALREGRYADTFAMARLRPKGP